VRAPALLPCIALVCGLLLAPFRSPGLPLCAAAIVLAAATVSASRGWLRTGSASIAALFFLIGNAAHTLRETKSPALRELYQLEGERAFVSPRHVEGRLRREPERARDQTLLTLNVESVTVPGQEVRVRGGLRVSVRGVHRGRLELLEASDRIVFWARLRLPSYFRNPGGFDGAAYLARQEIELLGSTKSGLLVTLDEKGPGYGRLSSRGFVFEL
jgi:predicted membrane metal-binding protein